MAVVLVVDDEVGIANLLADVLSDEGHRVIVAANGHEGLKRAEKERPDLIITDFMMPVMDGAQLIKALADNSDLKRVPVFLISSAPEAALCDKCSGYALHPQALQDLRRRRPGDAGIGLAGPSYVRP